MDVRLLTIQAVALNFPMGAVTDGAAVRRPLRPLIHLMSLPHALPFRTLTRFQVVNSRLQGRVLHTYREMLKRVYKITCLYTYKKYYKKYFELAFNFIFLFLFLILVILLCVLVFVLKQISQQSVNLFYFSFSLISGSNFRLNLKFINSLTLKFISVSWQGNILTYLFVI